MSYINRKYLFLFLCSLSAIALISCDGAERENTNTQRSSQKPFEAYLPVSGKSDTFMIAKNSDHIIASGSEAEFHISEADTQQLRWSFVTRDALINLQISDSSNYIAALYSTSGYLFNASSDGVIKFLEPSIGGEIRDIGFVGDTIAYTDQNNDETTVTFFDPSQQYESFDLQFTNPVHLASDAGEMLIIELLPASKSIHIHRCQKTGASIPNCTFIKTSRGEQYYNNREKLIDFTYIASEGAIVTSNADVHLLGKNVDAFSLPRQVPNSASEIYWINGKLFYLLFSGTQVVEYDSIASDSAYEIYTLPCEARALLNLNNQPMAVCDYDLVAVETRVLPLR